MMLKKRAPEAPAAEPVYEGMVETLNPRGMTYRGTGLEFPPGVWVELTAAQAASLHICDWLTVREKAASDG